MISGCSINICWMRKRLNSFQLLCDKVPAHWSVILGPSCSDPLLLPRHLILRLRSASYTVAPPSTFWSPATRHHTHTLVLYVEWSFFIALRGDTYVRQPFLLKADPDVSRWSSSVALISCFTNPVIIIPGHSLVSPMNSATERLESWDSALLIGFTVPLSSSALA